MTDDEKEALRRLDGRFVGQLGEEDLALFEKGVTEGLASRGYMGAAGFMGLARVVLRLPSDG